MTRPNSQLDISIGEHDVVVRTRGRHSYETARILGREHDQATGVERIWLDRVVAPYGADLNDGWSVEGAVSSILVRQFTAETSNP